MDSTGVTIIQQPTGFLHVLQMFTKIPRTESSSPVLWRGAEQRQPIWVTSIQIISVSLYHNSDILRGFHRPRVLQPPPPLPDIPWEQEGNLGNVTQDQGARIAGRSAPEMSLIILIWALFGEHRPTLHSCGVLRYLSRTQREGGGRYIRCFGEDPGLSSPQGGWGILTACFDFENPTMNSTRL